MKKIKGKIKRERWIAVMVVTAVFVLMWVIRPWKSDTNPPTADSVGQVEQVRRLLDGVMVEKGKDNPPLAGVMVENMIEAQPISGIADASLVFEAVTEANITRFLGYFVLPSPPPQSSPIKGEEANGDPPPLVGGVRGGGEIEIGPVRSARPYFLDWAAEFNTLFAHVGSSPAAYELLRKKGVEGVQDLDQWYKSEYFFSKNGRPRPHHLYTSTKLLSEAGGKPDDFSSWKFKNDASPDLRGNVTEILVGYTPPYEVRWVYDKFENRYRRMQWSGPSRQESGSVGQAGVHITAEGKEIIAKNIAVAFMKMKVLDEIGRKEFATIGEGEGLVFQDGRVVVGTWKKPSSQERLRFYDGQGVEVEFNAGKTWVEIVPEGYAVKY